ncbi:MAG: substrate-binding domain-containing protein [Rhodospirillales bacterium]|nr:substrate-binding domain-containing protein [Rhodospirillales bacterium]
MFVFSVLGEASARDQIRIVGSSTVYPFAATVAERFGRGSSFKTPVVESSGSGGGFKEFCAGGGPGYPDITNASRAIKESEREACRVNKVGGVTEVRIGYDGVVFGNSVDAPPMEITRVQLFLALAKRVPVKGELADNPHVRWNQIDPSFPDTKIEILGPPPTSGTRDVLAELVMEQGCAAIGGMGQFGLTGRACHAIREDGAYIEAGENDLLIVRKLEANPLAFGIFGFSALDMNFDLVQGAGIEGVAPEFETISGGSYPLTRPLYFYVKDDHVGTVAGITEFLAEFTSEAAWGPDGYLADKGLVPMPDDERRRVRETVRRLADKTGG